MLAWQQYYAAQRAAGQQQQQQQYGAYNQQQQQPQYGYSTATSAAAASSSTYTYPQQQQAQASSYAQALNGQNGSAAAAAAAAAAGPKSAADEAAARAQLERMAAQYQLARKGGAAATPTAAAAAVAAPVSSKGRFAAAAAARASADTSTTTTKAGSSSSKSSSNKPAPVELNKWVERCFLSVKHCLIQQKEMERKLKDHIRDISQQNKLWAIDWNEHPLLTVGPSSNKPSFSSSSSGAGRGKKRQGEAYPFSSSDADHSPWDGPEEGEEEEEAEKGGKYGYRLSRKAQARAGGGQNRYGGESNGSEVYGDRNSRIEDRGGRDSDEESEGSGHGSSSLPYSFGRGGGGRGRGRKGERGWKQEQEEIYGKSKYGNKKLKKGKEWGGGGGGKYGPASEEGGGGGGGMSVEEEEAKRRRQARFDDRRWKPRTVGRTTNVMDYLGGGEGGREWGYGYGGGGGGGGERNNFDFRAVKAIVGTCQELEKEYFRLNEVPDPASVRPEPVLRRALARLLRRFEALPPLQGAREGDYKEYLWTQLKAIRQDMLIQNLKNAFAVEVYEAHARIALACSDLNEFNQCQTQLMELYREKDLPASALANVRIFRFPLSSNLISFLEHSPNPPSFPPPGPRIHGLPGVVLRVPAVQSQVLRRRLGRAPRAGRALGRRQINTGSPACPRGAEGMCVGELSPTRRPVPTSPGGGEEDHAAFYWPGEGEGDAGDVESVQAHCTQRVGGGRIGVWSEGGRE